MEEAKVRKAELDIEIKVVVANKFEFFNKLENLAGLPEKYIKQVLSLASFLSKMSTEPIYKILSMRICFGI
jgi:hypothetical protein